MEWKEVEREFSSIKNELGNPDIKLLPYEEFWSQLGIDIHNSHIDDGGGASYMDMITVDYKNKNRDEIREILYHESLHCIFPEARHITIDYYTSILMKEDSILRKKLLNKIRKRTSSSNF